MEIAIINNQIAFFVSKPTDIVYEQLVLDIRKAIGEKFISPSIILPIPDDAPPEIPRVILETFNKKIKITIAKNRCDFFYDYKNTSSNTKLDTKIIDYAEKLANVLDNKGFLFNRIGIVAKYFVLVKNPTEKIKESLTKLTDNDIVEISIRINRRKQYDSFSVNDVYTYDQAIRANDKKHGILITRDINTLHIEETILSPTEVNEFVKIVIEMINKEDPSGGLNNE